MFLVILGYYEVLNTYSVLDRDTRESVLKCSYTDEQGFECEDELTIILYMPKDSNELEIY